MQVDIVDRRSDCQWMYDKGKRLVFTSNTENVFFSGLGRHCFYMLLIKNKIWATRYWRDKSRCRRTSLFSTECKYNPQRTMFDIKMWKMCRFQTTWVNFKNVASCNFSSSVLLLWIPTFHFWKKKRLQWDLGLAKIVHSWGTHTKKNLKKKKSTLFCRCLHTHIKIWKSKHCTLVSFSKSSYITMKASCP